jgi:exo-1,4-beta-D-glucosaminidase
MDRAGILIDGGFQCCDAWQLQDSQLTSDHDFAVLYLSARTIGENLRNHPSVMNFSWSDNEPTARQETVSLRGFSDADFQDPLIASAEYKSTTRLGPSGEKEGPYDWVPPSYWYDGRHFDPGDPTRANVGGAWAFDSESSAGHTAPTIDSIERFLSPSDQTQLWRNPDYNQYHANYEPALPGPDHGGYSFGTLHDLDQAISNRYGKWSSLREYVQEAQVQNYETQRAQFEAYVDHSTRRAAPSTGVVYWQLNKGWPTLLWVDVIERAHHAELGVQGVRTGVLHPTIPANSTPPAPAKTYFVEVVLRRQGDLLDRNVYWLSTQRDAVDWAQTMGNPQATMAQFADLRELQHLPTASVQVRAQRHRRRGPDEADMATDVTIKNTPRQPTVAFFIRTDVRRGSASGSPAPGDDEVLPVFWNDDDITLWPGESQTLHALYRSADLRGRSPVVSVSGWNVPGVDAAAQ